MIRATAFAAALLALSACDGKPGKYHARQFLEAQLRDPDSALYAGETLYHNPDGRAVLCGYVNARNAFGGMAGNTRFVAWAWSWERGGALIEPGALSTDIERDAFEALRADLCRYISQPTSQPE